jgi:hypothetical protein
MGLGNLIGGFIGNAIAPGLGSLLGAAGVTGIGALVGKLFDKDDDGAAANEARMAKWNKGPSQEDGWDQNLFKSRYTGPDGRAPAFTTEEERDIHDKMVEAKEAQAALITPKQTLAGGGIAQFAGGGLIQGPGTVTSDSIPGVITQNGRPVEEIAVGNGEVILSGKDLANMDPDGNMKRAGMRLGGAANGTRGAEAARMFAEVRKMKGNQHG